MASISEIMQSYEEAKSAWFPLLDEMAEDFEFYQGKQWADGDLAKIARKKGVALNLNYIKKIVDVVVGFGRQNTTMMKAFPIENNDAKVAEVYSRLIHWIVKDRNANHIINKAYKDATICGIGWISPELNFENDILSGDIAIKKEDPFNILVDPHFKEQDLSDADYLIRHQRVSKSKLKQLFPNKKSEIDSADTDTKNEGVRKEIDVPSDRSQRVLVLEYWHRVFKNVTFVTDVSSPNIFQRFDGSKKELDALLESNPNLRSFVRNTPEIMLTITAGDSIVLYDGANTLPTSWYPFIPVFSYIDTGNNEWKYRIQGMVRALKDPQREKNKRRSVLAETVGKMAQFGWKVEKGAVDDIDVFKKKDNIIEVNPGKQIQEITPTLIPPAVVTLEQMFDNDIARIGAPPEQLGQALSAGEAGVTTNARIRQGLMSQQEAIDNFSYAKRSLGRQIIEIIAQNYTKEKIQRILGDDIKFVPEGLEEQVKKSAEQAQSLRDAVEKEKEALAEDLKALEQNDEEITDEAENEILVQLEQMENQARDAEDQAQSLQAQLGLAFAEEKRFWELFDETRKTQRFDIEIDETNDNPTFRAGAVETLMKAAQFKIPVDPISMVQLMDIPEEQKRQTVQSMQQAQQSQASLASVEAQKQANEMELEREKMQNNFDIELVKKGINPRTKKPLPGYVPEEELERAELKLELEKIKEKTEKKELQ